MWAVLKEKKRKGHGLHYLCNGQAGRNAKQVLHFDERTCVVPSPQSVNDYIIRYGRNPK